MPVTGLDGDALRSELARYKKWFGDVETELLTERGKAADEINRLRAAMRTASMRLHGLATMKHSNGAIEECAVYLDDKSKIEA